MTNSKEKPKIELTNKSKNSLIEKIKSNENLLTRIGIYGANYFPELFSNLYKAKTSIGNAYGAIGFAALDVLARKNTPFKRLAKSGGYLWYVGEGVYDLGLALTDQENVWAHLGNFALDVSMAYQLVKDMGSLYKELNENKPGENKRLGISKDLGSVVSFIKEKFPPEKKEDKSVKENPKKFKEYLSNFGKEISSGVKSVLMKTSQNFGYGAGVGYGFGKGTIEKLAENYSAYRTKRKELNELKKINDEKQVLKKPNKKKVFSSEEKDAKDFLENVYGFDDDNLTYVQNYEKYMQTPLEARIEDFERTQKFLKNFSFIEKITDKGYGRRLKNVKKALDEFYHEKNLNAPNPTTQESNIENKNLEKKVSNEEYLKSFQPSEPNKNEFYFPKPNWADGNFNDIEKTNLFKEEKSLYKFTIISKNKANFSLVNNNDALERALKFPAISIENVCNNENAYNLHAKEIITTEPGIVEKEGDIWKVTKRAKIKYIK
ncbi:MAG: hypothetical protein AABY06_03610 [Nanoarchaeota archaeon]